MLNAKETSKRELTREMIRDIYAEIQWKLRTSNLKGSKKLTLMNPLTTYYCLLIFLWSFTFRFIDK